MSSRRRQTRRETERQRPRSRRKSLRRGLALVVFSPLFSAVLLLFVWSRLPAEGKGNARSFVVESSEHGPSISQRLTRAGFIKQPFLFNAYLWLTGQWTKPTAGRHLLRIGMAPRELALCLTRSSSRPKVQLTIPEGFDQFRTARRLEALGVCDSEEFLAAGRRPELLKALEIKGPTVEGYLFPLTYTLAIDSDPQVLISNWIAETRRRIDKLNRQHNGALTRLAAQRGWTEHELLTLASIIEKETSHDDERPIIAGVFFNRLDNLDFRPRRMLQSDPTAIYGCLSMPSQITTCTGSGGRVTPAMLRDAQNQYNTYRHSGLPPGPIANPGEASIGAVMTPVQTDYLYFVAKNGRHVFTRSLPEHESAIRGSSE